MAGATVTPSVASLTATAYAPTAEPTTWQYAVPATDVDDGAWTCDNRADLHDALAEIPAGDGDSIYAEAPSTCTIALSTLAARGAGDVTLRVRAVQAIAPYAVPELPREYIDTTMPTPSGDTHTVAAGGNLQAAITAASPGDVIELEAGATFTGNFTLPAKGGSEYIIIRSSGYASLPAAGTRVQPADASYMAKIASASSEPAIYTVGAASYYRFVGIEFTFGAAVTTAYALVQLNTDGATSLSQLPHHFVFDRCYIHGHDNVDFTRGIMMNSGTTAVIDSYISECHGNADCQAIACWMGPGPFKIVNNHLEASGENVLFGGADPTIAQLVPSDIEMRRNYVYKPTSWVPLDWTVKNSLETKNVRRLLVEGNVFENTWPDGQADMIVFMSTNQNSTAPWQCWEDITFRYNLMKNAPQAFSIVGWSQSQLPPDYTEFYDWRENYRLLIAHNILDNICDRTPTEVGKIFKVYNGGGDIAIDHNTVASGTTKTLLDTDNPNARAESNFRFTNNIGALGTYGINAVDTTYPDFVLIHNLFGRDSCTEQTYADNSYVADRAAIGLVGYKLPSDSPYLGGATDGTDPGADVDVVMARVAGVVLGTPE